jgi:hypothetical protein
MKNILISITSCHKSKAPILDAVIKNYRQYPDCNLHLVLCTAYDYTGSLLDNAILTPSMLTGWKHTWSNSPYVHQHYREYDYVIESDDDILIPYAAFEYYQAHESLPLTYIPGLLATETDVYGDAFVITTCKLLPSIVQTHEINGTKYIEPHNVHSACTIIDRARYALAIEKGWTDAPHRERLLDVPKTSRSGIYAYSTKVIAVDAIQIGSAFCKHLPNSYCNLYPYYTPKELLVLIK